MELNAENIEKALAQFYHDASSQQAVHRWLTAAQVSPQAWSFSWQLLAADKGQEIQFFGASCLHVKISRYWHEVPPDHMGQLRSQLLECLGNFVTGPRMVRTRLCVALASLTLHSMPEVWPNAIIDILCTFQQSNLPHLSSCEICAVLLEILTVLPEEFLTCHLTQHRKGLVRNELQKGLTQVMPLLQSVMSPASPTVVYEQALKCFSAWVQFGVHVTDSEALVVTAFEALHLPQLFDTAIEALVQVFCHQENHRFPVCMQRLLPNIVKLDPLLQAAINDRDMEQCQSLVRLIVTAADNSCNLLLVCTRSEDDQLKNLAFNIVKLVLECTAIPGHYPVDENCSDLSFGFWYNLQDDIVSSEPTEYAALGQVYIPTYMNLIDVLLQKSQFPSDDEYSTWNTEDRELHRCYRQDIADTLMYAYNLLHNLLLANLVRLLHSIVEKSAAEATKWQEVEAVLFAVTAIAENVDMEENVCLPALFHMLGQIPCSHPKLVSQALYLIGSYAEWISTHPEVLGSVIPLLLQGIHNTELAQSATLSLKEVVRENQAHLLPFATPILNTSKEALDSRTLKPRDSVRLMACVGYVLSVLPVEAIMEDLNVLLTPHITELQQLGEQQPTPATKGGILLKLNMFSWLFGSLNTRWRESEDGEGAAASGQCPKQDQDQPQPTMLVLQKVLSVLTPLMSVWVNDPAVVEAVSEMLKKALRTLMDDFGPLTTDVSNLVVSMFNVAPQPPLLDLSKQLMLLYASKPDDDLYSSNSQRLFQGLCQRSLTLFDTGDQFVGFQDHPDIVESFMSFLSQVMKKFPAVFENENINVPGLFQAGVLGLGMSESPTVKSSCLFLSEFIGASHRIKAICHVVETQGHTLVDKVMRAIAGESPRSVIDSMADVLLSLNKHHFNSQCNWLTAMVNQEGFPNANVKTEEKEQFARKVLKERVNKRRLKETVQEYTLLWRGLMGTEYASQTSSIMDPTS